MAVNLLWVILGAGILIGGGEFLVRGAATLARTMGISPMVVGLTVVALGTSAPEMIVCVLAASKGEPDIHIAVGNAVGSNILNVLLVLGVTALICPLQASAAFVRREVPIALGASVLAWGMSYNGFISRVDAAILVGLLVAYMAMTVWAARRESASVAKEFADEQASSMVRGIMSNALLIVTGLLLLGFGADLFLKGAIAIASILEIHESVIGLTLVALGTSLPELAACAIAALRKHPDICLGNLVGSNIYNMLAILGVSGLVAPLPVEAEIWRIHMPVMIGAAVMLLVFVGTGLRIGRGKGAMLLTCYAGYVGWSLWRHLSA